jgi:hypothetical protein
MLVSANCFKQIGKLGVVTWHYILRHKVTKLYWKTRFLDVIRVITSGRSGLFLVLGSAVHYFTQTRNKSCGVRVPNPHNDCIETLWIVLNIERVHVVRFQIQFTSQVSGRHNVLKLRLDVFFMLG